MNILSLLSELQTKAEAFELNASHYLPVLDSYAKSLEALAARVEALEKLVGVPAAVQADTAEVASVASAAEGEITKVEADLPAEPAVETPAAVTA